MLEQNLFAGFGGQGMLLIGNFLAYAGMIEGKQFPGCPLTVRKCAAARQTALS
jgi:hypothetical protein